MRLFGHLCGLLSSDDAMNFHPSDAELTVDLLAELYDPSEIDEKYGVDQPTMLLEKCMAAVEKVWATGRGLAVPLALSKELQELTTEAYDKIKDKTIHVMDVDAFLESNWSHWSRRRLATTDRLHNLFKHHDTNGDGVLSFDGKHTRNLRLLVISGSWLLLVVFCGRSRQLSAETNTRNRSNVAREETFLF